ncbi:MULTISPECIES: ABC transporter substrate-binding protein [Moraxella]|nr:MULTISPECIES: transporter substrate-binding domain-containing protein [Moraxella]MBE9579451.1 amino acid ABC transporter substrate-binding protein [Moraxella sp. K1664]MBE9588803.1 amino acid ABC transporter substrate-binding protein [Moraxella sp. K1630]MBE9590815.1 amino acid ABC transporter substrate-binding protein [Moraxella sp. K127]MBE9597014.1 amino acid ABC transporter substrate-binding protein [Moraxella sp. K2450]MDH9219589.1 transporter substrate-binding domain-containing protei
MRFINISLPTSGEYTLRPFKSLFALMLSIPLVACGDKPSETTNTATSNEPATTHVQATDNNLPVYRVGTMPDYAPYGVSDEKGQIGGLDIDILQAVAKDQGFVITTHSVPWDIMPEALNSNEVDIIANGLAGDDYPQDTIVATDSYMRSADCVWAKDKEKLANWQKGIIATPDVADMGAELAENFNISESQLVIDKLEFGSLQSLIHDRADVVVSDCVALDYFGKREEFKAFQFEKMIVPDSDLPEQSDLVFMVRREDDELLNKINQGLANIKKSGELAQIEQKWH